MPQLDILMIPIIISFFFLIYIFNYSYGINIPFVIVYFLVECLAACLIKQKNLHFLFIKSIKNKLSTTNLFKFSNSFIVNNNNNSILNKLKNHIVTYPTSSSLNNAWNFGFLSGVCIFIQILTGIFLTMHYTPHVDMAFDSVEHIMRDVNNGWYIRYAHSNGASLLFACLYIHIARGLYFKSYAKPKYLVWCVGLIIFILCMLTAFIGYVLPWGQMSYWGATVITNFVSAIPLVGDYIKYWLWGGYSINNATLGRFFALHFFLPFVILALIFLHLSFLHQIGSTNPISNNSFFDVIKFYPYFLLKDFFSLICLFSVLIFLICFKPNMLGHPDNYIRANPMVTPPHIVPEWYFLPFYSILRAITDKNAGICLMFGSIIMLFIFPLYSFNLFFIAPRCRFIFRKFFWLFVINFIILGWVGGQPAEEPFLLIGKICTIYYFSYFIIILPILEYYEQNTVMKKIKFLYKKNANVE